MLRVDAALGTLSGLSTGTTIMFFHADGRHCVLQDVLISSSRCSSAVDGRFLIIDTVIPSLPGVVSLASLSAACSYYIEKISFKVY